MSVVWESQKINKNSITIILKYSIMEIKENNSYNNYNKGENLINNQNIITEEDLGVFYK